MNAWDVVARWIFVAAVAAGGVRAAAGDEPAAKPAAEEVARLIKELGDPGFEVRQEAQKRLIDIGPAALEAAAKARQSDDPEVSTRAKEIFEVISAQAARRGSEEIAKAVVWKAATPEGISGPVRVSGGVAVFVEGAADAMTRALSVRVAGQGPAAGGDADGARLRALDAASGKQLWAFDTGPTPHWALAGGVVYVTDPEGRLKALDVRTGKARDFAGASAATDPAVAGGVLYVGDTADNLRALDAATGKVKWQAKLDGPATLAPVVAGGSVYVLKGDGKVLALAAADGKLQWSAEAAGELKDSVGALAVKDGLVYLRTGAELQALDAATGKAVWKFTLPAAEAAGGAHVRGMVAVVQGGGVAGGPPQPPAQTLVADERPIAVADGAVLAAAGRTLLALDAKAGKKLWEHEPALKEGENNAANGITVLGGGMVQVRVVAGGKGQQMIFSSTTPSPDSLSPPAAAGGVAYFGTREGLHALDARTCRPLWTFKTAGPVTVQPTISDGVIYFGTTAPVSGLVVFRPGQRRAGAGAPAEPLVLYALRLPAAPAAEEKAK